MRLTASFFIALMLFAGACAPTDAVQEQTGEAVAESAGVLDLAVLDSVSDSNTARVDSALKRGNAYDMAVAFHYYFHMSATDKSMTRRAIEIYDSLKASNPDTYSAVLYQVSRDLERINYGRMVDRHVEYLRSVDGGYSDSGGESVSR
ncbi:MAG: hypothetical protein K2G24_07645 [Muribaculaceae bacterium]|nr:hypothetical protein [Muribaculaceae bacterium]